MAESTQFGFCNVGNFQVCVDKLLAFETYLNLAVDTVLGNKPERTHISRFCVESSYQHRDIPKNWQSDGNGGYWETMPSHYWLDSSNQPLEICTLGSDSLVDLEKVKQGRETFAEQSSLVKKVLELAKAKNFDEDVLRHIPNGQYDGKGINERLFKEVMASAGTHLFDMREYGEGIRELTPEDLKGSEGIGYSITQSQDSINTLKIGLCKAYYPK